MLDLTATLNSVVATLQSLVANMANPVTLFNQLRSNRATPPNEYIDITQTVAAPGYNRTGQWSTSSTINRNILIKSKGIAQNDSVTFYKSGIGDGAAQYTYMNYMGGVVNGDDEAISGRSFQMSDKVGIFNATVTSSENQNTGLYFGPAYNAANLGAGRFLALMKNPDGTSAALSSGNIKTFTSATPVPFKYATITVDTPQKVSTAIGQATVAMSVPLNADLAQQITFTVNVTTGVFNTSSVIAILGMRRHEQARVVSVTPLTNGQQTITAMLRETYDYDGQEFLPYIFQGGCIGSGIVLEGLTAGSSDIGNQRFMVPVVGAIDPYTLVYSNNTAQGQQWLATTFPTDQWQGNPAFTLYQIAEVIGFTDESASRPSTAFADGPMINYAQYVQLEANDINWQVGSIVEQPPHYCVYANISFDTYHNDTGTGYGHQSVFSGQAINNWFYANTTNNANANTMYKAYGGKLNAPILNRYLGAWGTLFEIDNVIPSSQVFNLNADISLPTSRYSLLWAATSGAGGLSVNIDPYNNNLDISTSATKFTFNANSLTTSYEGNTGCVLTGDGLATVNQLNVITQETPASSTEKQTVGRVWFDDNYMYRVTSTGVIKRIALTEF